LKSSDRTALEKTLNKAISQMVVGLSLEAAKASPDSTRCAIATGFAEALGMTELKKVSKLWDPKRDVPASTAHVELAADLVALMLKAADRGERMTPYNGNGNGHAGSGVYHACDDREYPSYGEFGQRIARALGRWVFVLPVATPVAWPVVTILSTFSNLAGKPSLISPDKLREATARSWAASAAKARSHLDFAPAASVDQRLRETGDWFRSNGML
jgi:nucleoside-diphosphate-sugar epimerase